jgi:riboflavin kinase / FMN adenylyltransferase
MLIHEGINQLPIIRKPVVTSGTFDGVHMGHRKLLETIRSMAKASGGESVLLTFWPHPRLILHPEDKSLRLLSTFEEKAHLLQSLGIDHIVKIPFTKEFSQLSSDEFIRKVVVTALGTEKLVIGYDHRFGRNREGSFEYLKANAQQYGFEVMEIPAQDIDHITVSSTKVRESISQGDVITAAQLLGRYYELTGIVMHGDRIGRTMGYPTANIHLPDPYKLIPALGAYAVKVQHGGQQFQGMMNIGFRPTVNGHEQRLEVHIFDFDQEIYGETLKIEFVEMIRKELKFESLDGLQRQLQSDEMQTRQILLQHH